MEGVSQVHSIQLNGHFSLKRDHRTVYHSFYNTSIILFITKNHVFYPHVRRGSFMVSIDFFHWVGKKEVSGANYNYYGSVSRGPSWYLLFCIHFLY